MSFERRPLLAGNWKMNGLRAALAEIERAAEGYDATLREKLDLLICPPARGVSADARSGAERAATRFAKPYRSACPPTSSTP